MPKQVVIITRRPENKFVNYREKSMKLRPICEGTFQIQFILFVWHSDKIIDYIDVKSETPIYTYLIETIKQFFWNKFQSR